MSDVYTISIAMILLLIGINLTANNTLHSYIIIYVFYDDKMSNTIIRVMGLGVLSSIVLLLMSLTTYAWLILAFTSLVFIFLGIRGRAKVSHMKRIKILEAQQSYENEMEAKRKRLEEIKMRKHNEYVKEKEKPQSVKDIKEKLWDDGSMTNKEIIENLKDD